jgi:hypothetical protein
MPTWMQDVVQALTNLGGVAPLRDIYEEVQNIRAEPLSTNWTAVIRALIEDNSSDSARYKGKNDIFFSAKGVGGGVWGLRSSVQGTPSAQDIAEPEPQRAKTSTYRILRDTLLARTLKALYRNECQICGFAVQIPNSETYSEAHHIKPLGKPHNGPDIAENIIVLCPNHHVMCDYGAIHLDLGALRVHPNHSIGNQYIDYHNNNISKPK